MSTYVKFENDEIPKIDKIEASIEVNLKDDTSSDEVFSRAADFFVEHNDNFIVSWEEANERLIIEDGEDPSNPPIKGMNTPYIRWKLRRCIHNILFRLLTLFLIVVDLTIVIIDLSVEQEIYILRLLDLILSVYFVLEILLRVLGLGFLLFFSRWYNAVDFIVVTVTFVAVIVIFTTGASWTESLTILVVLRLVRLFRLFRLWSEKQVLETASRQMISQNKRRFQTEGWDLDLTYITSRVLATSFPSSGLWALYRNPIRKLADFLNAKHKDKYRVFNLCSEKTYDTSFFSNRVDHIQIDDHNVPSIKEMFDFVSRVRQYLSADPENVIVVHCKGGKGRTGTMICVWLVESGLFTSADESLDYFGHRRTDTNVSRKFQGVETPSQSRYVGYFEKIKMKHGGVLPEPKPLIISEIILVGMRGIGAGNASDFWVNIDAGRKSNVYSAHFGYYRNCTVEHHEEKDEIRILLQNCPNLNGDIRILFQTSSNSVPKGYEKCPFYFWFHTAFIVNNRLRLSREQLDNPHKPKTWGTFRENFSVELLFTNP